MICAACQEPGHASSQSSFGKTLRDTETQESKDEACLCSPGLHVTPLSTASSLPEAMPFPRRATPGLTPVVQQDLPLRAEQSHRVPLVVMGTITRGALPT